MIDAVGNPQTILLLGGTSDIGLAIVDQYASSTSGATPTVVLAGRPSPRLTAAAEQLTGHGVDVRTVDFDAADPTGHQAAIDVAFDVAGADIDIAIVAFGLLGDAERAWTDHAHAMEMAQVNYTGAVSVGVLLAERMRRQRHGVIVALSSVAGERVRRSNFVYGSTKAGMDGFFVGLGEALRPEGVRVVVVRPGFVKSKMTTGMDPAPMAATPHQVAEATVKAIRGGSDLIWVPAPMRAVMSALRHVPRPVFRKLPM